MNQPLNSLGINSRTGLPAAVELVKTRDEPRTASVALVADETLICPIGAGETLIWEARFYLAGNGPGNMKFQWVTPAAPAHGGMLSVDGGVAPVGYGLATAYNVNLLLVAYVAATDDHVMTFYGTLTNGVNPGEFGLQWAQNAANVLPSVLLAGSSLTVWRLAP